MIVYEAGVSDNFSKTDKCTYGVHTFFLYFVPENYFHVDQEMKIK